MATESPKSIEAVAVVAAEGARAPGAVSVMTAMIARIQSSTGTLRKLST